MIDVGFVPEDALGAAAHDDAVTFGVGFFDDLRASFTISSASKTELSPEFEAGGQGGAAHGLLVEAAQP